MRVGLLGASAAAALLCAACTVPAATATPANPPSAPPSLVPQTATSAPAAPSTTPTAAGTPAQASTLASASTPSPASTPSSGDQPVASRPGSFREHKVTAQLYPVRRSGDTATVDLYIESRTPDETFMLMDYLGDGNTETASKSLMSVDGIRLLDTTNKKAYLPAVTADGTCMCSPNDDIGVADEHTSVWVAVTFAAPPTNLTTMSVLVPSFGTFTNVPVV